MAASGILFLAAACAQSRDALYEGPKRPASETALVELNTYAQKKSLRWVVREVRLAGGPSVRRTFDIAPGARTLEVEWQVFDASERPLFGSLLMPIADRATKVDEGTTGFTFEPEAGRFYRLQWAARPDASLEGEPRDMELTLVDAGLRPRE